MLRQKHMSIQCTFKNREKECREYGHAESRTERMDAGNIDRQTQSQRESNEARKEI